MSALEHTRSDYGCAANPCLAVVRLLCIALIRTFYANSADAAAAEAALMDHAQRWSLDDRTLQVFTGILGVAIGSSATGSGGPMTPRLFSPRGRSTWEGSGSPHTGRPSPLP
jgi:hypothetical protein